MGLDAVSQTVMAAMNRNIGINNIAFGISRLSPAPDLLVPTGDVGGLAAAIVAQLSRPSDAAVLRAQAGRYTLTASLEAYVRLFREAVHGPALNPARNPSGSRA